MDDFQKREFERIAREMIKFLCENCHPHFTVIITPINAELVEGYYSTGRIEDYIKD